MYWPQVLTSVWIQLRWDSSNRCFGFVCLVLVLFLFFVLFCSFLFCFVFMHGTLFLLPLLDSVVAFSHLLIGYSVPFCWSSVMWCPSSTSMSGAPSNSVRLQISNSSIYCLVPWSFSRWLWEFQEKHNIFLWPEKFYGTSGITIFIINSLFNFDEKTNKQTTIKLNQPRKKKRQKKKNTSQNNPHFDGLQYHYLI